MDHKIKGNSSKELLYSEYTGTTVVEHVLETLGKKSNKSLHEKIGESFKKQEKSETFERVKKLMSLIENEQDASNISTENLKEKSVSKSAENKEEIEVVMEVDENSPESNVNAWFLLKLPKEQECRCSDDDLEKKSPAQRILDLSVSSDSSDGELEQNFPVISNGFLLNDNDSSDFSSDEKELNPSVSSRVIKKNSTNFCIDSSDTSGDESDRNFPVIVNRFLQSDTNSSNSSGDEDKQYDSFSSKMQNSSSFVNDDSSNSSDIKNEQYLYASNAKGNINCAKKNDLQLSIPLKKNKKRAIEISDSVSSEDLHHKFLKQSSNAEKMFSEKKPTFNLILNGSSNHSLDECEQNDSSSNGQKYFVKDNYLDSTSVTGDVSILKREELTVLETGSTKLLCNETAGCFFNTDLKRKFCVIENEITNSRENEKVSQQKIKHLNF